MVYTFHSVGIAQRIESMLTGESVGGDIGNHDGACLLPNKGVS